MIEGGYDQTKIDVLENGVPLPEYTSSNPVGGHVAYVGRMREEKGVDTLLKVARKLPACKFVFVGDGPERARWEAASTANCSFLGTQSSAEVEQIYRTARLIVVPSLWWEPCPLVVLEAMSHGRPVVAARSGGLPELVSHGADGLLFPPGDDNALSEAISTLWSEPALAQQMGENARRKACRDFGEARFADRLVASYLKAISGISA